MCVCVCVGKFNGVCNISNGQYCFFFGVPKLVSTIYLIRNGNVFDPHTDACARTLAKNDRIVKLNGKDEY